jgi:hypothetical protein
MDYVTVVKRYHVFKSEPLNLRFKCSVEEVLSYMPENTQDS